MTGQHVFDEAHADGVELIERDERRTVGRRLGTRRRQPLAVFSFPFGSAMGGRTGADGCVRPDPAGLSVEPCECRRTVRGVAAR
jgi:hypothetical protein